MMKRLLTMTIALLSVLGVWADETTIYERKASGGGLSESTSATQVSALWSTKDIYSSADDATAGGWTLEDSPSNVTATIAGGLKLEGNNGNNKSQAFTYSKAISVSSNTSILRLTADWDYSKNRAGNSGDVSYYAFLKIGDVEIRYTGKDNKIITICNGVTTETATESSDYYGANAFANISVTINQTTKVVSYTVLLYKSSSDENPKNITKTTASTGENVTYNLSAGYSKAGGGSATTDIIKNIKVTEEAQDVTLYSYTVNYKVGDNVVKTVTSSLPEGSAIPVLTALDGEGDYTGHHYLISADEAQSWTISSTVAENTHGVEVRAPYSTTLTVTRNFDGVAEATPYINGQALVETDEKVANWVYTFPYYVQNDEKWYRATLKDEKYGEEGTFTSEAINKTIDYTLDNTVINFWDYSHTNYVNNINYSGGSKNDYQQGETIGNLDAGIYEITVMQDADYSAKLYKDYTSSESPGTELLSFDNSDRTRVLTLTKAASNLQIASSGNSRYDYVLVRKLKYTLTSSGENGTIVMKKNDANGETITSGTKVDGGTTIYVSATPNDGYYLASLTKKEGDADAASFVNGTTFTLLDATIIAATFTEKTDIADAVITLDHDSFEYNGEEKTPSVTGVTLNEEDLTLTDDYTVNTITAQTNVGNSYTVTITGTGHYKGTATKTWRITAADASVTAPTAVDSDISYTGEAQTLFNAGTVTGGTLQYKVTTTNTKPENTDGFADAIPQETEAGTYYLWYYVNGDANHKSTAINDAGIEKTIANGTLSPTVTPYDAAYDGTSHGISVTCEGATIKYSETEGDYTLDASPTITNVSESPKTVYYKVSKANYADVIGSSTISISPVTLTATAQNANRYVGEANPSFTVEVTGFVNSETAETAAGYTAPTATCSATTVSVAGTYDIVPANGAATNYTFNYVNGTLTVNAQPTYTITGVTADEHGNKVEADAASATAGTTVTLTITPAENYTLKSISATGVTLSGTGETRTFTMPASDVTIKAVWEEKTAESAKTEVTENVTITDASNAEVSSVEVGAETTSITISGTVSDGTNDVHVTSIAEDAFVNVANKEEIKSVDLSETSISGVEVNRSSGVFKDFPDEAIIYMPAGNTAATGQKNVVIKDGSGNLVCADFEMVGTEVTGSTDKGKSYNIPKDFKANKVTLNREFTTDTYCTVCLPYAMSETAASAVGKFYYFSGISGTNVQMTEKTGGLDANTPYIFKPSSNASNISETNGSGITVSMAADPKTANGTFTFQGAFEYKKFTTEEIASGIYGFAADTEHGATSVGQFVKAENGAWIQGMRGYLMYDGTLDGAAATSRGMESGDALPDALNVVLVNADGSTTNIGRLELINVDDDTPRYNLSGQRVSKSYKGIVIINGKKVIIK